MRLLLFLYFISFQFLQAQSLSFDAKISVLTVGPGLSLSDAFGHSGIRVQDSSQNIDIVFGYGNYDFNAPNFYLKFAKGKLNYMSSKEDFERFYKIYVYYNRSIKEQTLNLNQYEKEKLYQLLLYNNRPENRAYLYDFFYDNCATKIRDITSKSFDNKLLFNKPVDYKPDTFRTLIQDNLNKNSWGSLGIDIALGSIIDRVATPEEQMFLPENIYRFFANTTLDGKSVVQNSKVLFEGKQMPNSSNILLSPFIILGVITLGILLITFNDYKNKKRSKWLDVILLSLTGCLGIVLLLLWFATDHNATAHNYNLLWAFASNIIVIGQAIKNKPKAWFVKYIKFLLLMLSLLLFHWFMKVQVFAITLIPILVALTLRYIYLVHYLQTKK